MPERKVGEIFEFQGMKLKCELSSDIKCDRCRLKDIDCLGDAVGPCTPRSRHDQQPVIFIEVE